MQNMQERNHARHQEQSMTPEHRIMAEVRLALAGRAALFRANVGQAWQGTVRHHEAGTLVLANARPLSTGLPVGFPDLFGWAIQGDVARFLAIECKAPGRKPTMEQSRFLDGVRAAGGLSGVAYSVDDALAILSGLRPAE
jgi:hypothetical protein